MDTVKIILNNKELPIYTSYFSNKSLNDNCICINLANRPSSQFKPSFVDYLPAIPDSRILSRWYKSTKSMEDKISYIKDYYKSNLVGEICVNFIKDLTASSVVNELFEENPEPDKVVLLCHELPGTFCHRLIFSIFLDIMTGVKIQELDNENIFECEDAILIRDTLNNLIGGGK